tara:strand:+ start:44 stop:3490 length:3447 start_codon:yes stop_codon:yes gene_type:complete
MVASAIFKLALKAATPKSFSKMKSDYVPSPVVKETTDVLKALGKTEDDIVKFRQPKSKGGQKLEGSEKEVYKNPDLEEQAIALDEGLITLGEFKEARDILKPRKTYGTVPKLYENFDIIGSLPGAKGKEYGIVGVNKNLKSGELVSSRFDIPAYRDYGRYVVTIRKGNELFGYAPTAILKNVKFTGNPNASKFSKIKDPGKKSFKIAQGKSKTPFAVMEGKWQNMSPESTHKYAEDLMDAGKVNKYGETDKEWTEIGFDPASKSSFYNRSTGEPIFAADKVVQIGPMLLARGIKKPTKEQLKSLEFTTKAGKKIKGYKEGGQIMPMQYGGGISGAYSTLSNRRKNLPLIKREAGGGADYDGAAEAYADMAEENTPTSGFMDDTDAGLYADAYGQPGKFRSSEDIRDTVTDSSNRFSPLDDPIQKMLTENPFYFNPKAPKNEAEQRQQDKNTQNFANFKSSIPAEPLSRNDQLLNKLIEIKETKERLAKNGLGIRDDGLIVNLEDIDKPDELVEDPFQFADFDKDGKPTPEFLDRLADLKESRNLAPTIFKQEGGSIPITSVNGLGIPRIVYREDGGSLNNIYQSRINSIQNMYGMGDAPMEQTPSQMSSVFQDPMETSAFSPVNMEKGGDIVVPQERMINNQPHQLSYINPQEAGLLKALGGSGRRVDGIPAYFDTGMDNDFSEGTGESFSGGDMSGSDDSGQDALSTFLGESSLADAFGTPSDPIGPGEGFEAGPDDKESTDQSLASYMRSDPQGFMNRATDKKGNFRSQQVADLVQAAADRGNLQGIGIPFANAMEKAGLASFGKGMRSSLEAFTPGKALTRNDYDPEVLAGNADLSENPNKVAIQAFGDGIRYSKSGDSIADVTAQMSALGFTEDQINNAAQAFGYSPNSTAQASQVYDSLNDARKDGAIQGLGLVGSILTSPISGFSSLGRGFYGQRDEKGNPIEKSVMDRVGDEVMQTDLGKSISGSISDTLGKDSKAGEIASTIGKGIGMINDPFGTILGQRGIRQTSVPNILEATPDNRYFSGPSSETPSGLEKGISSIVDFFGGPQAAYRNNIDVRQGEGQDEPISRRPRINEPVESATASSSGSNDGRLMNKFFAGLAATNVGKKSSGEGSIFRLIKSQNPQLTDDQIRAMIPNENNFA